MRRRQGFTLVEMMVSIALVLFIMVILSQAFQTGLESFRRLKGIGDMEEMLRAAVSVLRRDLSSDHFEGKRRLSDPAFWVQGPPREGFFRLWQGSPLIVEGVDGDGLLSTRATNHMLHFTGRLRGNGPQDFLSATLPMPFPNANFFNQPPDSRYQESALEYKSQWFEVAYYLRKTGTTVEPGNMNWTIGTPLFALYRRQLLAVPDNSVVNWTSPITRLNGRQVAEFSEMSCRKSKTGILPSENPYPDTLYFNNPTDLTVPVRRFGMLPSREAADPRQVAENAGLPSFPLAPAGNPLADAGRIYPVLGDEITSGPWAPLPHSGLPPAWQSNPALKGADVLLADVISFEVKVFVPGITQDFVDLFELAGPVYQVPQNNPVFYNRVARPTAPIVFDTWSIVQDAAFPYPNDYLTNWNRAGNTLAAPLWKDASGNPIRIAALQITLRVWDAKTQQARQITIVQDM